MVILPLHTYPLGAVATGLPAATFNHCYLGSSYQLPVILPFQLSIILSHNLPPPPLPSSHLLNPSIIPSFKRLLCKLYPSQTVAGPQTPFH